MKYAQKADIKSTDDFKMKYSVKFSIKNNINDTLTPVRVRVSYNSIRTELYIKTLVKPSEWNKELSMVNIKSDRRNTEIARYESIIDSIFTEYNVIKKRFPTPEELKEEFSKRTGGKNQKRKTPDTIPLYELKEIHIESESESKQWSNNTIKNHKKLINHLKHFFKSKSVNDVTEKSVADFLKYLQTKPLDKNGKETEPHKNTSLKRIWRDLKQTLIWASKQGYYLGDVHEKFKPRFKGADEKLSDVIFLTWAEINKMYEHTFKDDLLNDVKDVYCFCAFSSLRFSDVQKLKKSHIRNNSFVVATEKTTEPLIIELNDYTKAILKKYKDYEHPQGLALPIHCMKFYNKKIKLIGEQLGFDEQVREAYYIGNKFHETVYKKWQLLSSHSARRTFIVNAITLGIPVEVIIKWTGHKDYDAMKPYIKIVDELKKKEMSKFNITPKNTPEK